MRFKERRSDAFSVKDETKVAIGDEWQGQDSAVISSEPFNYHFSSLKVVICFPQIIRCK
jgi:hypothetical protein